MSLPLSVIIPALNEEARIGAAIDAAFAAGAAEVIVADGGSRDGTAAIATARGATLVTGESVRARQLNRGAATAAQPVLLFVHADTLLPPGAGAAVVAALGSGAIFGGFRVRFLERTPGLRWTEFAINFRTRLTGAPWGDQAQFTSREAFFASGQYMDYPIMEDYELAVRMKRQGRTVLLPLHVTTSGRRFLEKGLVRTTVLNWLIIICWRLGVSPERLARWYRK